jgi:hypothetical protein
MTSFQIDRLDLAFFSTLVADSLLEAAAAVGLERHDLQESHPRRKLVQQ